MLDLDITEIRIPRTGLVRFIFRCSCIVELNEDGFAIFRHSPSFACLPHRKEMKEYRRTR